MRKGFRFSVLLCLSTLALHAGFLDEENTRALKEKKLVLISIESDTCPYCKKMKKEIFNSSEYRNKIDQMYIYVPINTNDPSLPESLRTKYIPAHVILSPAKNAVLDAYAGYIDPKSFIKILDENYKEAFQQEEVVQ